MMRTAAGLAGLVVLAAPAASFSFAPLANSRALWPAAHHALPRGIGGVARVAQSTRCKMQDEDAERKRMAALEDEVKDNTGAISYVFPRPVISRESLLLLAVSVPPTNSTPSFTLLASFEKQFGAPLLSTAS